MAIDLGDKRTGLAVGDMQTRIASPAGVLEVSAAQRDGAALIEAIVKAVEEHGAKALVVGLPLNMDGSEGPRAKKTRAFAERLARATGLAVEMQDERLTSSAADWRMARTGLTREGKKMKRDALAAAALLEDFLAARAGETRPATERGASSEPGIG
ncbi:MAG: Holliday junction resolvase RuvX [Phycisphaerales bacterium]